MRLILILVALIQFVFVDAQTLRIGTYNIRYKNSQDQKEGNGWEKRAPRIVQQIDSLKWDVFGAQEVLYEQLKDMRKALSKYDCIGVGREDGKKKGEFAPVFYNKERFECIRSGTFWLSETDSLVSTGWDAALPRICTWVQLCEKQSMRKIWFFNCHLDHKGEIARTESIRLILRKIELLAKNAPVILTGDFNAGPSSATWQVLRNQGLLRDTYRPDSNDHKEGNTFNDFREPPRVHQRIDYIFVSQDLDVKEYQIVKNNYTDSNGTLRYASDHYPVRAILGIQ